MKLLMALILLPSAFALGSLMVTAGVNLFGQSSNASLLAAAPLIGDTSASCQSAVASFETSGAYPAFLQAGQDWKAASGECFANGEANACSTSACDDSSCKVDCSDEISDNLKSACEALATDAKLCGIDGTVTNPNTQCTGTFDGFGIVCLPKACQNDDDENELANEACGGLGDCSAKLDCGGLPDWAIGLTAAGGALLLLGIGCWCWRRRKRHNNVPLASQDYQRQI